MTLSPVRAPWTETKQAFVWKAKSHFSLPLTSAALPCTTRCASDPLPLPRAAPGAAGRPAPQPQHRQQLWQQGQSPTHSSALLFGPGLKPGVRMHSTRCCVCTRKDRNSSSALTLKALQSPTRAKTEIQKCFWKKPTVLTEVPIAEAWTVSPAFYTNGFLFWTCKWAVSTDSLQYHLKVKSVLGTHRCMSKAIFIFDIYPVRPSLKYS